MNIEFMCELLANYSKELSEAETYREKGEVQLKHAKLILDKVKNCSIPAVVGQSEELSCGRKTMKTAVDWLIEQLKEYDYADIKDSENYIIKIPAWILTEKQEKAKEMEKQQMFDYIKCCYVNGENSSKFHQEEFEKYYNKTFCDGVE